MLTLGCMIELLLLGNIFCGTDKFVLGRMVAPLLNIAPACDASTELPDGIGIYHIEHSRNMENCTSSSC